MNSPENTESPRGSLDRDTPHLEAPGVESGEGVKIEAPGDRNPPAGGPGPNPGGKPKTEEVRRWEDEGGGVPDAPPPTTVS